MENVNNSIMMQILRYCTNLAISRLGSVLGTAMYEALCERMFGSPCSAFPKREEKKEEEEEIKKVEEPKKEPKPELVWWPDEILDRRTEERLVEAIKVFESGLEDELATSNRRLYQFVWRNKDKYVVCNELWKRMSHWSGKKKSAPQESETPVLDEIFYPVDDDPCVFIDGGWKYLLD